MTEIETMQRLVEAWGDWVDPKSYLNDTSGFGYSGISGRVSVASDRQDGDNPPFWQSEQEHAEIRGICRFLAQADEVGVGAIRTLTDYVVGWGSAENWKGRDPRIVGAARRVWENVCDAEGLRGQWEREFFSRRIRDGERCAWVHEDSGEILVDLIEPEFITQPGDARTIEDYYGLDSMDWKYGVATTLSRPSRWHGLYASFFGSATDWEWLPKRSVVWTRANVDAGIKRGVSDLYPVFPRMDQGSKLLTNLLKGGAIQSAIAYIREHAPGTTASGIASVRQIDSTATVPTPSGGKTVRVQKFQPGTVLDVSSGMKYTAGPVGAGAASAMLELVQAAMRIVGTRWAMPEYLISGDASNGNYASTLVAEAPFTKNAEAMQAIECHDRRELIWKVLDAACRLGRFKSHGITDVAQLRAEVDVDVTLPPVAVRNRIEDAQVAEIEKRNGVLSARTWAEDAGRDYVEEVKRGAADQAATMQQLPALSQPDTIDTASTADGEMLKPAETALNGAQVQAAVTIVQSVAAGTLPRDAGLGQLQIMFNLSQQEAEKIMGSVGRGFEPAKLPALAVSEAESGPKKYDHIDFTPPEGVRNEAAKGLEWRKEHGRGGTAVGVARARDLSNGTSISPETAKRMYSYFARHEVDKEGEGWSPKQDGFPSAGRIAWALWGGDAGEAWASKLVRQMAAADDDVSEETQLESLSEALAKCWRKYP